VGLLTFCFDIGGGTQHITQSISTVNKYALAGKMDLPERWYALPLSDAED